LRKGGCNAQAHPSLVRKHQALIEQSASSSEVASVQGQLAQMTKDDEPESILLPARHLQSLLVERCRRVPVALEFRDLAKEAKDPLPRPVLRASPGRPLSERDFLPRRGVPRRGPPRACEPP